MTNPSSQETIWTFISAYKDSTGQSIGYLDLISSSEQMLAVLDSVAHIQSLELRKAAADLVIALEQGEIKFLKGKSAELSTKRGSASAKVSSVRAGYTQLLSELLFVTSFGVVQREELDHYCKKYKLPLDAAETLENDHRQRLGLDALDWRREVERVVSDFVASNGDLTDVDRLVLYKIYVKKRRVSITDFDQIVQRSLKKKASANVALQQPPLYAWLVLLACVVILPLGWLGVTSLFGAVEDESSAEIDRIDVEGVIDTDQLWQADRVYRLRGPVYVEAGALLTIEPGTRIEGEYGSALIVTASATLYARGQPDKPIVFTSSAIAGQRQSGDWGGVVLLGKASINQPAGHIEGVPASDSRGNFGGKDDGGICGVLEYVRIEFAGHEVFANNELNGLTLGGCGSGTVVRYVQVHRAADDGIEMFGGTADLKHIVITGARDDSLDWDMGWRGRVQYLIARQYIDRGDNGIEADNRATKHDAQPVSHPVLYNITLIGNGDPESGQRALTLRRGSAVSMHNFIALGQGKEFLDVRDVDTAQLLTDGVSKIDHGLLFNIGQRGITFAEPESGEADDDQGFDEGGYLQSPSRAIETRKSPLIKQPFDEKKPTFTPSMEALRGVAVAAPPQDEFWDEGAAFLGAVKPSVSEDSWLSGWTEFPQN